MATARIPKKKRLFSAVHVLTAAGQWSTKAGARFAGIVVLRNVRRLDLIEEVFFILH